MGKMKVAVQVYSVREAAEADFKGTAAALKAMGYDALELAGMYGKTAEELRAVLDEVGIPALSAHIPFAAFRDDLDKTIADYAAIGCQYVAIPSLPDEYRPGAEKYAETLDVIRKAGAAAKAAGMTLLYHNHDFEFEKLPSGAYGLDDMYAQVSSDLLQTEIDTCWVKVSGVDPAAYVKQYAGRCPVVHLKDFFMEGKAEGMYELIGEAKREARQSGHFEFRPVGHGLQDMPAIVAAAAESGADWVVVEQDSSVGRTPMEAVEMSRRFLAGLGL